MFAAIAILTVIDKPMKLADNRLTVFPSNSPLHKITCALFFGNFLFLMFLGCSAAAVPYVLCSKVATALYFIYFLVVLPLLSLLNSQLLSEVVKTEEKKEENGRLHPQKADQPLRSMQKYVDSNDRKSYRDARIDHTTNLLTAKFADR